MLIGLIAMVCALSSDPTSLDLTAAWRFKPDPNDVGVKQAWFAPEHADVDWATIDAGHRWEDQGFPEVNGNAWYRRTVKVPESWRGKRVFFVLGAVNDAGDVYCNGRLVNAYGDPSEVSLASTPLAADLTDSLRPGEANLIALRVYDRGGSGGLWSLPCMLTTDEADLAKIPTLQYYTSFEGRNLTVEATLWGLGHRRPDGTLHATLSRAGSSEVLAEKDVPAPANEPILAATFELPEAEYGGRYDVRATLRDRDGKPIGPSQSTIEVVGLPKPVWTDEYEGLKVLNSLVTELLSIETSADTKSYPFLNPRDGWVFVAFSGNGLEGLGATIDDSAAPLVFRRNPD